MSVECKDGEHVYCPYEHAGCACECHPTYQTMHGRGFDFNPVSKYTIGRGPTERRVSSAQKRRMAWNPTGYVIKRVDQWGGYATYPGTASSYTPKLQYARVFKTREAAERERCPGNEIVVAIESELGHTGSNPAEGVLAQILSLSSGTMATLTDARDYATLDVFRKEFHDWTAREVSKGRKFEKWQDAWKAYARGAVSNPAELDPVGGIEQFEQDWQAFEEGSLYKIAGRYGGFKPTYAKSQVEMTKLFRELSKKYPEERIDIIDMRAPRHVMENPPIEFLD